MVTNNHDVEVPFCEGNTACHMQSFSDTPQKPQVEQDERDAMHSKAEGVVVLVLYKQDSQVLLGPYEELPLLQMTVSSALEGQDLGLIYSWSSR